MEQSNGMEQDVFNILLKFLEKATGDNATAEEIAVIPQIAEILLAHC